MAKKIPLADRKKNPVFKNEAFKRTSGPGRMSAADAIKRAQKKGTLPTSAAALKRMKRNPETDSATAAKALYKKFHQKAATSSKVYPIKSAMPLDLAELGELLELHVKTPNGLFILKPKGVKLTATPDGKQLYFVGGDQRPPLKAMGISSGTHQVKLGQLSKIRYLTQKGFHNFEPVNYGHTMGEEGGFKPDLNFDTRQGLLFLVDGSYEVKRAGIVH